MKTLQLSLVITLAAFAGACATQGPNHANRMKELDQKGEIKAAGIQQEQTIYHQIRALYCDTEKTRYFSTGFKSYIIVCEDFSRFTIPIVDQ